MRRFGLLLKYVVLIPIRLLFLPRIYRRLVAMEGALADLRQHVQVAETENQNTHSDLQRRVQVAEEDIRNTHPDLLRRMQVAEEDIRNTHPDLLCRMLTVENNIRSLNPEEHTRLFNEARHEYYIAETMLKALSANLRDFTQTAAELKAKQAVLESLGEIGRKNLDLVRMHEAGLAAAVRELTQEVNLLKDTLSTGEGENGRKER